MGSIKRGAEDVDKILPETCGKDAETSFSPSADDKELKTKCFVENQAVSASAMKTTMLDLSDKNLDILSVSLDHQITSLNISNNCFETLPNELHQLVNLTSLAACENKLKELPDWIGDLRNLTSLKLSGNSLQSLPLSFRELNFLKELDISKNNLDKIPDSIQVGCISLQYINMSHNDIVLWTCQPASAPSLQTLYLAHNLFTSIPLWMWDGKACSLVYLDISANPVFTKEHKISNTSHKSSLKKLSASNCCLSQNQFKFVGQFTNLTHLELGNHEFPKLKDRWDNILREMDMSSLQFCKTLVQLSLRKVWLPDLPEDIDKLESLEILDCRDNNLLTLPDCLCKLSRLRVCHLSNNTLCILPDRFGELTSLEELHLSENKITVLPTSFGNLENLRWLDLYGNLMYEIPDQMEPLIEHLMGLDLELNCISLSSELDKCDNGIRWLTKDKYVSLMENMRRYLVQSRGSDVKGKTYEDIRCVGSRPPSDKVECSSNDSYRHWSDSSDSDSQNGDNYEIQDREEEYAEDEEEDWNESVSDTDNFDAVEYSSRAKPVPENETVIIPRQIFERHNFCPSDLHVSPTQEDAMGEVSSYAIEEGQFDDA